MIEEAVLAGLGYVVSYVGYRYLNNKKWGTHQELRMIMQPTSTKPLTPTMLDSIQTVDDRFRKLKVELPYDQITIDERNEEVTFWKLQGAMVDVANEGPSTRVRILVGFTSALIFLGSAGLTVDLAHKALDVFLK